MNKTRYNGKLKQYLEVSYSGQQLLSKHSLSDVGVWRIEGEDPNCDFGGAHSNPFLGYLEGRLLDVVTEAVSMPGFWTWGGGGNITKVDARKADPVARRALVEKRAALAKQLADIDAELGDKHGDSDTD